MRYVIETATGTFLYGGPYHAQVTDPATQSIVELPDGEMPDVERDRYDAARPTKRRRAAAGDLAAAREAARDRLHDDILAQGMVPIIALLTHLPAIVAALQATGTIDAAAWAAQVTTTAKQILTATGRTS